MRNPVRWKFGKRRAIAASIAGALILSGAVLGTLAFSSPSGSRVAAATPAAGSNAAPASGANSFLDDLAGNLGIDRATLDAALKKTGDQEVDAAVQSGRLTQAQGDRLKQAIDNGQVPRGFRFGLPPGGGPSGRGGPSGGPGGGPSGRGGPGGQGLAAIGSCVQNASSAVSQALGGATQQQIRSELRSGKTFDQIAQENGTTVQAIQGQVASSVQPCLDQAVTSGSLTQDQENKILDGIRSATGLGLGLGIPGGNRGPRRGGPQVQQSPHGPSLH